MAPVQAQAPDDTYSETDETPADIVPDDVEPPEAPGEGPSPRSSETDRRAWLTERLDRLLDRRRTLARTQVGIAIMDVRSGHMLYAKKAEQPFQIASVAKLVTTASALGLLGPEFRFTTSLHADAWDGSETIQGNLYLRSQGDPSLTTEVLLKMASDLRLLGITRIEGSLVVDDTYFDSDVLPPAFDQKDEDGSFRAPVSATALNFNTVVAQVQPGSGPGMPARVTVIPPSDYVEVVNNTVTVGRGRTSVVVKGIPGEDKLTLEVTGNVRFDAQPARHRRRIEHPHLYMTTALRGFLSRYGIKIAGEKIQQGTVPEGARFLVKHRSEALGTLVRDLNKFSNNFMAETLVKVMGAETGGKPGSFAKGLAAMARWLGTLGIDPGTYRIDNGSGLYDSNRFTPAQLVTLLSRTYNDFRISSDFVSALALSGADGTIAHRMSGGKSERFIRAKTGTLDNVSCLAGYASAPGQSPIAFAVLVNDIPSWRVGRSARRLQDDIAEVLVAYLSF